MATGMSKAGESNGLGAGKAADAIVSSTATSNTSGMAWHDLPNPDGVNQYCNGGKVRIQTDQAIKVNMKVNVLEVSVIDQVREVFTAIFTVQFYYIDPMLADFRTDVTYVEKDGRLIVEKNCKLTGSWKYSSDGEVTILCESGKEKVLRPTSIQYVKQPDWDADPSLFRPAYTFGNAVATAEVFQQTRMLEYCSAAGGHVFEKVKYLGTFAEQLELHYTPFDRQMLSIRIYGEEPLWRQQLVAFKDGSAGRLDQHGGVPTEWAVDDNVQIDGGKVPSVRLIAWTRDEDAFRSTLDVVIHVKRVPTFIMWNVVFINFCITLLTLSAFACFPDEYNERVNIQFLLLLTSVGYKVVTAGWLPVKSYLTFVDMYGLSNLFVQAFAIAESWLVIMLACNPIDDDDDVWTDEKFTGTHQWRQPPDRECWPHLATLERWFACALYGSWVFIHAALFVAHKLRWTDRFFPSWNAMYKDKKMLKERIESYDKLPYGFCEAAKDKQDGDVSI